MKRLLILVPFLGCASFMQASPEKQFWAARAAYLQAETGYQGALQLDNSQISACYAKNKGKAKAVVKAACPPKIDQPTRDKALSVINMADAAMVQAETGVATGATGTAGYIAALDAIQQAAVQLPLLTH
jgi:hypothetical protein